MMPSVTRSLALVAFVAVALVGCGGSDESARAETAVQDQYPNRDVTCSKSDYEYGGGNGILVHRGREADLCRPRRRRARGAMGRTAAPVGRARLSGGHWRHRQGRAVALSRAPDRAMSGSGAARRPSSSLGTLRASSREPSA